MQDEQLTLWLSIPHLLFSFFWMTEGDFLHGSLFASHFPSARHSFLSEKQRPCATVSLEVANTTARSSHSHMHARTRTSTPPFHSCFPPRCIICSPFALRIGLCATSLFLSPLWKRQHSDDDVVVDRSTLIRIEKHKVLLGCAEALNLS